MEKISFSKLLSISTLLVFTLTAATLTAEASQSSTNSADLLFNKEVTQRTFQPANIQRPTKVLGASIEIALITADPGTITENPDNDTSPGFVSIDPVIDEEPEPTPLPTPIVVEDPVEETPTAEKLTILHWGTLDIHDTAAKIYWQSKGLKSFGEYRYSADESSIANLDWDDTDVINGLDSGNRFASIVTIRDLEPETTYYVEVRRGAKIENTSSSGTVSAAVFSAELNNENTLNNDTPVTPLPEPEPNYETIYGESQLFSFTTLNENDTDDGQLDKITVCHYNQGKKSYVAIKTDENGYKNSHQNHDFDFIKTESTRSCLAFAHDEGILDGGFDAPPVNPINEINSDNPLVKKLKARVRQLKLTVSDFERTVIKRERKLIKKINKELTNRLKGRILLQVEGDGEAWYVDEDTGQRFYLRDGKSAYDALRAFGLGISNADLDKIPIGTRDELVIKDTDGDGLPDKLEEAIGTNPKNPDSDGDGFTDGEEIKNAYNPLGSQKKLFNKNLANRLLGKILLQVEDRGQAWYLNPEDGKRYYMQDGDEAYRIMRHLSLGITNEDLSGVDVGDFEEFASE